MLLHELALGPGAAAAPHPDALLLPDGSWSRDDLRQAVAAMVAPLATLAPPGGRIALAADNRPEVVALLLAIPAAGRVAVPIDTRLAPDEMMAQLHTAGVSALIGTAEALGRLAPLLAQAPPGRTYVGLDPGAGDISLTALVAAPAPVASPADDPDAPAWIYFTGGPTGSSHGVVLTAHSLGEAVNTLAQACPLADSDVYLHPFPLDHVSITHILHALRRGRPVVLPRGFDPAHVTELADRHGATALTLAPTMLRALLDHRAGAEDPTAVLAGLRTLTYTAAAAPALLAEADATLDVELVRADGMLELSGPAVFLSPEDHRRGLAGDGPLLRAAGRPAPGVELRIVDADGAEVATGTRGEVTLRGAQLSPGYWGDPEASARALRDGWLHTGDVGIVDADGLLTIVDPARGR